MTDQIRYSRDIVRHLIVTEGNGSAIDYIVNFAECDENYARGLVDGQENLPSLRATQSKAKGVKYIDWLMGNNKKWDAL